MPKRLTTEEFIEKARLVHVADKWKDKIEPNVYLAMYNYKVEIDD